MVARTAMPQTPQRVLPLGVLGVLEEVAVGVVSGQPAHEHDAGEPYWPGSQEDYDRLFRVLVAYCAAPIRNVPVGTGVVPCLQCAVCTQLLDQQALIRFALVVERRESYLHFDADEEVTAARQLYPEALELWMERERCRLCDLRRRSGEARVERDRQTEARRRGISCT